MTRGDSIAIALPDYHGHVTTEWIDPNEHMSAIYYHHAFREAYALMFSSLGMSAAYIRSHGMSFFQKESHVRYERELLLNEPILIKNWIVATNEKCIHHFHEMFHGTKGYRAATGEFLHLSIDMARRTTGPMSADMRAKVDAAAHAFAAAPRPEGISARIEVRPSKAR